MPNHSHRMLINIYKSNKSLKMHDLCDMYDMNIGEIVHIEGSNIHFSSSVVIRLWSHWTFPNINIHYISHSDEYEYMWPIVRTTFSNTIWDIQCVCVCASHFNWHYLVRLNSVFICLFLYHFSYIVVIVLIGVNHISHSKTLQWLRMDWK